MPGRRFPTHRARAAAALRGAATAALFVHLALLAGCGPSDPLERVRVMQEQRGDLAGSVEPLRELMTERPDDPEVQFRYGLALLATEQRPLAVWPLQLATESEEWKDRAALPLAHAYVATGAFDDAIETLSEYLERNPDDVPALLQRAHTRLQSRRDYEGALADADRVLELDPENGEALAPRTVALLALERVEEAAESLDALEGLYREESLGLHGSAGLCAAQATFAREKGDLERAEELYDRCLEDFPADPVIVGDTVDFFDELGKRERSQQILEKAVAEMPDSHHYRGALVLRLRADGKKDEAMEVQRAGTEAESPLVAAEAWAGLAALAIEDGDYDEAVKSFAKARQLDSTRSPQLAFSYADTLVIAGRYDDALAVAETLTVPAHRALILGRVALERGETADALKHFSQAALLWPNNAIGRYYAAVAAERLGRFARAIEEYRYAMRIDPVATDAYLRLAHLHLAAGRDEDALAALTFKPGARPEERDGLLLHVYVLARLGRVQLAAPGLMQRLGVPENRGAAAAAVAKGLRETQGPELAVRALLETEGIDLRDPADADALAALVEHLAAAGRSGEGLERAAAAVRAHPKASVSHAIHGRALALHGQGDAARAAFERALELDADEARAHVGLARLALARGEREAALASFDRALAVTPDDFDVAHEAVDVLVALERREEAEKRLEKLLQERPYDARASLTLAELLDARGADAERTRELARRAVQFGGGEDAQALLERVAPGSAAPKAAGRELGAS